MFKKILLALIIFSAQSVADNQKIIQNLAPFFGKINSQDISKTPLDGIFEVVLHSPIEAILVSADGRFFIKGDVIDLTSRSKMSAGNGIKRLKKSLLDGINEADKIIFKAKNEKYAVHVFTDVDCPFCQKFHAEVPKMNKFGITVKYLASPLAQLHPTAQGKMQKIWCAKDRVKALDNYKKHQTVPNSKACDNPVAKQLALAQKLGVNGTPAIFLPNGSNIPGYIPAAKLLKRLERAK
ncbi:MAG: DsbC family protein [Candidatus Thioglobus sp.]|nr:DsbC family protein [Candidatus Thioglobus sp.]